MLLCAIGLILANGFFVLSEFAIVKIRKTRLEELSKEGISNAKLALKMSNSLDTYLSATQLGITLSSLALGWIGEPAVARLIEPLMSRLGFGEVATHSVAVVISFILITLLHVVLGELVPKSIAIAKTERSVLLIARPLHLFWLLFFPVIKTFDFVAMLSLKLIKIQPAKEGETAHSDEEIKIIAHESLQGGMIGNFQSEVIKNAVDFSDTVAHEIMTPRRDMVCLSRKNSLEENLRIVYESKFTRFPYIGEGKDDVLGMIHIRDILLSDIKTHEIDLEALVRKFIIVPENSNISNILVMMNKERISAALVIDEYGGTAGLLTMEDIIEELVGDINDEHDEDDPDVKKLAENSWECKGSVEVERVEELSGVEFSEDTEQQTIGGYVFNLFQRLPEVGEKIEDANFVYEIVSVENLRVEVVKATLKESVKPAEA